MATHGARRLILMNANLARIVAIEMMAAIEGIDFRRPLKSSPILEQAHALVRKVAHPRPEDRGFSDEIEAVAAQIEGGEYDRFVMGLLASL